MLKIVIAGFTNGAVTPEAVLSPVCPVCSEGPAMVMPSGTQAFCGNDDCEVLMWDPTKGPEQVQEAGRLIETTDDQGRITWRPEA